MLSAAGIAALFLVPDPSAHAYDATVWVLVGYGLLHHAVCLLMIAVVAARRRAGHSAATTRGAERVSHLWSRYTALTSLVIAAAVGLPGALT